MIMREYLAGVVLTLASLQLGIRADCVSSIPRLADMAQAEVQMLNLTRVYVEGQMKRLQTLRRYI